MNLIFTFYEKLVHYASDECHLLFFFHKYWFSPYNQPDMYAFEKVNHGSILGHAVLISLTPLIPIPFLDDWVKSGFQRRMLRQIAAMRGVNLSSNEVAELIQEDFWDSCVGSCLQAPIYLLREVLSKIFFIIEIRRALGLFSKMYYTGFLFDAALLEGYPLPASDGSTASAIRLREAIRRARYGANLKLMDHLLRENLRPLALLKATWGIIRQAVGELPKMLAALPGAIWRGLRGTPGAVARGIKSIPARVRENFFTRVQVLLGKEKAPELKVLERMVQSMQASLLQMDSRHFDTLVVNLQNEIRAAGPVQPVSMEPKGSRR